MRLMDKLLVVKLIAFRYRTVQTPVVHLLYSMA